MELIGQFIGKIGQIEQILEYFEICKIKTEVENKHIGKIYVYRVRSTIFAELFLCASAFFLW